MKNSASLCKDLCKGGIVAILALPATLVAPAGASESGFAVRSVDVSTAFPGRTLLAKAYGFGCDGGNRSPRLAWSGAPAKTKSFVVTIHDPDAETGVGWTHWVVVNIPATQQALAAGITAAGGGLPRAAMQTRTDFGVPGYAGPCPPVGKSHRYRISVRALDVGRLPAAVDADATPALVGFFARQHSLAEAVLEVRQGR